MTEKLDIYDLLAALVPGTLFVCLVPICFPAVTSCALAVSFPEGFAVIALVVLAVFVGHMIQALASSVEEALWLTWGGRPSDVVLAGAAKQRYMPRDSVERIKRKLRARIGADASDQALFRCAVQLALSTGNARVERFNALYGYHRGLLVLAVLAAGMFATSMKWGAAAACSTAVRWALLVVALGLVLLLWNRTRQRGVYYAREVLDTAERALDAESTAPAALP